MTVNPILACPPRRPGVLPTRWTPTAFAAGLAMVSLALTAPARAQAVDGRLRPDETREYVWTLPRDRAARAEASVVLWAVDPRLQETYRIAVDPVEVLKAEWGTERPAGLRDLL